MLVKVYFNYCGGDWIYLDSFKTIGEAKSFMLFKASSDCFRGEGNLRSYRAVKEKLKC